MPRLAFATLGSPEAEWRKRTEEQSESSSEVSDWTPRPDHNNPEILGWWLDTLGLCDAAKAKEGDLEAVGRLRGSMLARWDEALVPSIKELQTYCMRLRGHRLS
ncbi:hypothetical protein FRC08_005307 [Ceratobasidium sp. 394]|nr:hypothetical protein FRC08_005307 [Ceratobasidium sp. 394]